MNRLKSSVVAACAVIAVIGVTVMSMESVNAQGGSAALSIAPKKNYTIEPGKEANDTLLIRNIDREQTLNLSLRVIDFTYTDDGGTPKLMLAEDAPQTTWSIKSFTEIPESVSIEPGQSESVPINVSIPENQGAGSYYSAVVYSSGAADGGNVGFSASGVTLVFVTIPGEVNEKLTLENLGTYNQEEKKYQLFNMNMPSRIAYTLNNEGNVAESPVGSITLKNIFGQEKVISDINPNGSLALIGQTRTFEACVTLAKEEVDFNGDRQEANTCGDAGLWPGFYTVTMQGFYGQNGNNTQEIFGKGYFFYLPLWFVAAVFVALLLVGYHGWRFKNYLQAKRGGRSIRSKK